MTARILTGDALEQLRLIPDESVHCCVTSPPYWGLRDYGCAGQYGLEPTINEYVLNMIAVFAEVRRVLRDDGTLWLNVGDSYHTGAGSGFSAGGHGNKSKMQVTNAGSYIAGPNRLAQDGLKPKDLCGIPWRLAFALQADGWWLRQDIIWSKPNPMPESVTDRCTKAHEYIFLLSKSERYWFDAGAIAEEAIHAGENRITTAKSFAGQATGINVKPTGNAVPGSVVEIGATRNKRSVWTVTTQGYSEAHFATFPPALIEPCILAGCPADGTVLDPFGGAMTTALVADRLQRNSISIELNPAYVEMGKKRLHNDAPLFVESTA